MPFVTTLTLNATRQALNVEHFLRGRPILSGEGSGDTEHGAQGINLEASHGYAVLTQTIASNYRYDMSGATPILQAVFTGGTGGPGADEQAIGKVAIELGAHVVTLKLTAVIKNGTCRLDTDQGAGTDSAAVTTTPTVVTSTATISTATGVETDVWITLDNNGSTACTLYSYHIHEVRLTSVTLP